MSEEDIERIAELAAKKALEHVYAEVGKGVLKRIALVLGSAAIGLLMWLGREHIDWK